MKTSLIKKMLALGVYVAVGVGIFFFVKNYLGGGGILLEEKDFSIAKNVETRLSDVKGMDEIKD